MTTSNSTSKPHVDEKDLQFARFMRKKYGLEVRLNRQLLSGKTDVPSLVYNDEMAKLIIQNEPFFMAQKLYGINPSVAVSLDKDMVMDLYNAYPNMTFFCRVNWESYSRSFRGFTVDVQAHKAIYVVSMKEIKKLINRGTPEHVRKTKGGDRTSFIFDSTEFKEIS